MKRSKTKKVKTEKTTQKANNVYVIMGNDWPMSASYDKALADREVQRLNAAEDRARQEAVRQHVGLMQPTYYHIHEVKLLEESG